jgi:hypothetical protein
LAGGGKGHLNCEKQYLILMPFYFYQTSKNMPQIKHHSINSGLKNESKWLGECISTII